MNAEAREPVVEEVEFAGAHYSGNVFVYPRTARWTAYYNLSKVEDFFFDSDSGEIPIESWVEHRDEIVASLGENGFPPDYHAPTSPSPPA